MRTIGLRHVVALGGALVLAQGAGGRWACGDEHPRTSSAVKAPAQGGGGVEPVPGAPPAIEPSLQGQPARATLAPGPRQRQADAARASVRAVSMGEGEATLEIDGAREVVRPGTKLGDDTVKSIAPERIVLERPAKPGQPGALVILTFDDAGRTRTRVFWMADPASAASAEVKRP